MELLKHTKIKRYVARSRKQEEKIPRGKENDLKNHEHYTPWTKNRKKEKMKKVKILTPENRDH